MHDIRLVSIPPDMETKMYRDRLERQRLVLLLTAAAMTLTILAFVAAPRAKARQWQDQTGKFSIEGEVVGIDRTSVALNTPNRGIVMLQISQLSDKDQEYLKASVADDGTVTVDGDQEIGSESEVDAESDGPVREWNLTNGESFTGEVVGYFVGDWELLREKNEIYVDRVIFDELPKPYRTILPAVVNQLAKSDVESMNDVEEWLTKEGGGPINAAVEGIRVKVEGPNADLQTDDRSDQEIDAQADDTAETDTTTSTAYVIIPAFLLVDDDRKVVEPGIAEWKNSQKYESESDREVMSSQDNLSLRLRMQQRYRNVLAEKQVQVMQLQLLTIAGGVELWEVGLTRPNNTVYGYQTSVVVPADDSYTAQAIAKRRYPRWQIGAAVSLSGR